jgi:hypothetical protein
VKTWDGGLIPNKLRVSYAKLPHEGVSGNLDRTIPSKRPRLDLSAERAGAGVRRVLIGGLGMLAVGVLGLTAHPGLPLEVLFVVGRCYRL